MKIIRMNSSDQHNLNKKLEEIPMQSQELNDFSDSESLPESNKDYVVGDFEKEMIHDLKDKISKCDNYYDKIHFLTILPRSWSAAKIVSTFKVSYYLAAKAKRVREKFGFASYPTKRQSLHFNPTDLMRIKEFYYNDEVSRLMPGQKDCVSVKSKTAGKRECLQKRLILSNLKEAYAIFKGLNPDLKIGFVKFTQLRPKECVLADHNGTHNICVCEIHQNFKFMFNEGLKPILEEFSLASYHEFLSEMLCENPKTSCHFAQCTDCPGFSMIERELHELFENQSIHTVSYPQWTNTDRCSIENITEEAQAFIKSLGVKAKKLQDHHFIAKSQSSFLKNLKANLEFGQFVVIGDFSQNYLPIVQDSIQKQYWNNHQITVHPFVVYRSERDENDQQKYDSIVMISECTDHNAVSVHLFLRKLINRMISIYGMEHIKKIYYFSDGAASQYKNKSNFINLVYHSQDFFGIQAEWHFFATSHGKNACDGVGGTVKRYAARESLRRTTGNFILNAKSFFDVVSNGINNVKFELCSKEDHMKEEHILVDRFKKALTIKGTKNYHCFVPINDNKLLCKKISSLEESEGFLHEIYLRN